MNDLGEVEVKLEPGKNIQQNDYTNSSQKSKKTHLTRLNSEENRSLSSLSIIDQGSSPNDSSTRSESPISSAPLCRQFWKAGNYNHQTRTSKITIQNATGYLHIHPRFLHSNATSHKWAFGAIAELLDNAVDEMHKGATFVTIDKISNPKDNNPALLIQDNGGGMDPESMRGCMSFGFSDKKNKLAIGQYGNGFKTSSMRLGADAIVFSRCMKDRKLTQSIGLLSYTFLTQTGHDRIVVPMVDYEFDESSGKWNTLNTKQHVLNNLSIVLKWGPYSTEEKLLKQFEEVGDHGTRIMIYNLWCNGEGKIELDFDTDPEDIRLLGDYDNNEKGNSRMTVSDQHLANRLKISLRAYLSILYLHTHENFAIILRGKVVEYHNIAKDLKYPEFIMYRPHNVGASEGSVLTSIGFLKEAPLVNIHGFNVYHKNRLILPFWHVVSFSDSRGRGVVGVLEANFIEPTHNKQEFEITPVFQKLEHRLKEMTWEYWDYHCGLLGYQSKRTPRARAQPVITQSSSQEPPPLHGKYQPVLLSGKSVGPTTSSLPPVINQRRPGVSFNSVAAKSGNLSAPQVNIQQGAMKRRERDCVSEPQNVKRKAVMVNKDATKGPQFQPGIATTGSEDQEAANLIQENIKLHTQCLEYEKNHEELNAKVTRLRGELKQAQREYARLLIESKIMEKVKNEKNEKNVAL